MNETKHDAAWVEIDACKGEIWTRHPNGVAARLATFGYGAGMLGAGMLDVIEPLGIPVLECEHDGKPERVLYVPPMPDRELLRECATALDKAHDALAFVIEHDCEPHGDFAAVYDIAMNANAVLLAKLRKAGVEP